MAIKTIEILNVMVFRRHLRKITLISDRFRRAIHLTRPSGWISAMG